jgi:hypothetical protein
MEIRAANRTASRWLRSMARHERAFGLTDLDQLGRVSQDKRRRGSKRAPNPEAKIVVPVLGGSGHPGFVA